MQAEGVSMEARWHTAVHPPLTCQRESVVSHPSVRRRCERTVPDRLSRANVIRRLERVRRVPSRSVSLVQSQTDRQLPVQVHSALQILITAIGLRDLRITEIQWPHVCGTSEMAEANNFAMATMFGMETICGMETIIFAGTGENTYSRSIPVIGIAIGTDTAIIGGMVIGAASLTEAG